MLVTGSPNGKPGIVLQAPTIFQGGESEGCIIEVLKRKIPLIHRKSTNQRGMAPTNGCCVWKLGWIHGERIKWVSYFTYLFHGGWSWGDLTHWSILTIDPFTSIQPGHPVVDVGRSEAARVWDYEVGRLRGGPRQGGCDDSVSWPVALGERWKLPPPSGNMEGFWKPQQIWR